MSPSLRSSTTSSNPGTPQKPSSSASVGSLPTPNTTPRRVPHCKTCGRPRAGHPRSGCPYSHQSSESPSESLPTSPSASSPPPIPTTSTKPVASEQILDAFESLHIEPDTVVNGILKSPQGEPTRKRRLSVRFALAPDETLASLSSTSSEIVASLLQPGMMCDESSSEEGEKPKNPRILRWQKSLVIPHEPAVVKTEHVTPKSSYRMPGTLITPTPSVETVLSQSTAEGDNFVPLPSDKRTISTECSESPSSLSTTPRALTRTMSVEERSAFVGRLMHESTVAPAMLFGVPTANLAEEQRNAKQVGFHSEVIPSGQDHAWLILGRDENAVAFLTQRFQEERKKEGGGGRPGLKAAAGGVMVGAIATWTGLAFS